MKSQVITIAAVVVTTMLAGCSGGLDPQLGAALIYEEEITDNLRLQVVLKDEDLLEDSGWLWD